MGLNRQQISQIYRPTGVKAVSLGNAWSSGGAYNLAQGIDLSLPISGLRFVLKGRFVIGTADFTSVNPEGFLNLISNINITGTNTRQRGNVTLYSGDLATLYVMQNLFENTAAYMDIGGTVRAVPTTPFPAAGANGYASVSQGTYDVRIIVDLKFHPYGAPASIRPGFLVRQEEWGNSLQVQLTYGAQTGGAGAVPSGFLGVAAATSTLVATAYGSAAGSPTVDIYSLPMEMGLDLKNGVLPGIISRAMQPINTALQAAGNNVNLLTLQQQKTLRVVAKFGTSTVAPYFATLSDTNVTALGILLGGNRVVREVDDVFAHKMSQLNWYGRPPIQGYNLLDFIQSGNPDSAYPADQIGNGSQLQLIGNVTGVANAYGLILQEQMIFPPDGALYNVGS